MFMVTKGPITECHCIHIEKVIKNRRDNYLAMRVAAWPAMAAWWRADSARNLGCRPLRLKCEDWQGSTDCLGECVGLETEVRRQCHLRLKFKVYIILQEPIWNLTNLRMKGGRSSIALRNWGSFFFVVVLPPKARSMADFFLAVLQSTIFKELSLWNTM